MAIANINGGFPLFRGPSPFGNLSPTAANPVSVESRGFDGRFSMMRQLEALETMLEMFSGMLGAAPANSPAATGPAAAPVQPTATAPAQAQTQTGNQQSPPAGRIGQGSRVLVIGDSHTAGAYGNELDRQLRARGAQVHTIGSSGASASNFINGRGTTVGYAEHGTDGRVQRTARHATPKLEDLIQQDRPDTIVVNLGANFRGASPAQLQSQVRSLGEVAQRHNIPIKWVGPPKPRQADAGALQRFDEQMAAAVAPFGEYISSVPYTPEYAGGDGVHYGGTRGTQLAQQWAQGVASRL